MVSKQTCCVLISIFWLLFDIKGEASRRMILRIQSSFLLQMQNRNQISLPKNKWNNYIGQAHLFSNPSSSPNLDQTNNFLTTQNVTSRNSNLQIIDLREINHMTTVLSLFSTYITCSSRQKVNNLHGQMDLFLLSLERVLLLFLNTQS